jgi:hypothetical protein
MMGMQYQQRDWDIVDYQEYALTKYFYARGPAMPTIEPRQYFACVGAAQTFGCFCEKPYPLLLQEQLRIGALNLGRAGAGPRFFLNDATLLKYINEARFVIVQVMSGRSEDNSLFRSGGLEWLTRLSDGVDLGAEQAYKQLLESHDADFVANIVRETRTNWIYSFEGLLRAIQPPKILFWFSQRDTQYIELFSDVHSLFGQFPQLINASMVFQLRALCDEYVECISSRGMPQLLLSRFTGQPATVNYGRKGEESRIAFYNAYYPSPEMQVDAANILRCVCLRYL